MNSGKYINAFKVLVLLSSDCSHEPFIGQQIGISKRFLKRKSGKLATHYVIASTEMKRLGLLPHQQWLLKTDCLLIDTLSNEPA